MNEKFCPGDIVEDIRNKSLWKIKKCTGESYIVTDPNDDDKFGRKIERNLRLIRRGETWSKSTRLGGNG